MRSILKTAAAAAAIAGGLAIAPVLHAQESGSSGHPTTGGMMGQGGMDQMMRSGGATSTTPTPSQTPGAGHGTMGQGGAMQGSDMMGMMNMMGQMSQMMDTCNRLMQSMLDKQNSPHPDGQQGPAPQAPQGKRG